MRPGRLVARRHHVGVAGEHEMRRGRADAGVEILDVGGAGLASNVMRCTVKPAPFSTRFENASAPPSAGVTDGQRIRSRAMATGSAVMLIAQSRSSSLMLVLARVCSSTRLTITAQ